jgi:hypothetical protein
MGRYLTDGQLRTRLAQGRVVDQAIRSEGEGLFSWVSISRSDDGLTVRLHRVVDEGSPEYLDVYAFSAADPDDEFNEGRLLDTTSDVDDALAIAKAAGAEPGRWVAEGTIQDDYRNLRHGAGKGES